MTAFRGAPNVLAYESASSTPEFRPTVFFDVTKYMYAKLEAAKLHVTQNGRSYMDECALYTFSAFRGFQAGCRYAEAFEAVRWVVSPGSFNAWNARHGVLQM
jgi:LmbE family N-acetylglucosaminyl deacetylase